MNRPCIQRTIFVDAHNGDKSFGYRIYDDHGQDYCNTLDENDLKLPDQDFLHKAKENFSEVADSIFDYALEHGIYVDDEWYHFDLEGKDDPVLIAPTESQ